MAEESKEGAQKEGVTAPAAPATPAQPIAPAVAAPASAASAVPAPVADPKKVAADKAAAEEAAVLRKYGVETPEALQAKLKKLDELETAQLSDKEKSDKQIKELKPKAEERDKFHKLFSSQVQGAFDALPEAARAAIDATAKGDAEKRWDAIQLLRSSGLLPAGTAQPTVPAPASVGGGTPPPPANGAPSKWDEYQAKLKQNPIMGGIFYQHHTAAIEASKPAN